MGLFRSISIVVTATLGVVFAGFLVVTLPGVEPRGCKVCATSVELWFIGLLLARLFVLCTLFGVDLSFSEVVDCSVGCKEVLASVLVWWVVVNGGIVVALVVVAFVVVVGVGRFTSQNCPM